MHLLEDFSPLCLLKDHNNWIEGSGAPIQSWIQSMVPTFNAKDNPNSHTIGIHIKFQYQNTPRVDLIVRGSNKNETLVWKAFGSRFSDGWLYGNSVEMTGNQIAYIYDDFETAILGHFSKGKLVNGTTAIIKAYRYVPQLFDIYRTFLKD